MRDNQKENETKMTTLQIPENQENKDDSKGNLSQKSNSCSNLHDLKNDEQDPGGSPPLSQNFNDQQKPNYPNPIWLLQALSVANEQLLRDQCVANAYPLIT